ncbi:hypothetical protein QVD17_30857 [Tagetes erecta]|uniref:Uncharacterized protein n=1 Tax=Tagetes erecta TaxID=13708 RepID=A0AAD8K530_TARER|nr:hypothetical protein QVD17_30857 [Tagetes erecta]
MKKTDVDESKVVNQSQVSQSKDVTKFEEVEVAQSEEVALMAQLEQPKVDSSSSDSKKPSNYVQLPEDVREKLCSVECLEHIEHYRTYSFKIWDKLDKEEKKHKKLKEDHKISDEKIL